MCGLTGFLDRSGCSHAELLAIVTDMAGMIVRRGPDDGGAWADPESGIALGSRRLAIVDLSSEGHQPMLSASGRYVIAFNGEIYNFPAIRAELQRQDPSAHFRGHSDTEVLLAAISQWGVTAAIERTVGMFAFALWDRQERLLYLGRDRLGEKPLYYGWIGDLLVFGSELKALRIHPAWRGEIDRDALTLMLRYGYIPAPHSIYQGISKLSPGTIICIDGTTGVIRNTTSYWSAKAVAESDATLSMSDNDAIEHFDMLLREAIRGQMIADVPLGAFLSGGVDSSLIVALMQGQSARPVKTFTIGFHEASHNEAQYAKAVATHLGTDHTELYVSPDEAMNVVPLLPTIYDEPFADPSQIPTFLVSHLARQSVTVSLSGDGGDELFSGYTRYAWGQATWDRIARLPPSVRKAVGVTLGSISADGWTRATETLEPVLPSWIKRRTRPERIHRTLALISAPGPEARYDIISTSWNGGRSIVRGGNVTTHALNDPRCWAKIDDFTACMMYLDTISYLPDDILVKVDRASMAVSLEARAPYLDHRIVEFAWSLPKLLKVREGQGKWIMRRLLDRYVPREMIERPKQGFGVPIDTWLREPLRPWAEALLAEDRLAAEGFLDPAPVRKKWKEHLNGERNWQYHLWQVLMFQAWLEAERTSSGLMTKSEQLVHHL